MRYHGGKWRLAPWIVSRLPPHRIYVEPFGGGGSVLLRKPRAFGEVYNDLDGDVVNVFRVLRDPAKALRLRQLLDLTPWARDEFVGSYRPPSRDPVERARRTLVRAFMGFGTSWRKANRTGFRAKAWRDNATGPGDWRTYSRGIAAYTARLRGVCIENRPALEIIAHQDGSDTLFYVDPPYPLAVRTSVRWLSHQERAYCHDLDDDEHRELAALLHSARGAVVVSGYRGSLFEELYGDWHHEERQALADGARKRTEVLWFNPRAAAGLESLFVGAA